MKRVLSLLLVAALLVCMIPGMAFASEGNDWKFYASVESFNEETGNGTSAEVRVFDDYSAVAIVDGTYVNPAQVNAYIAMQNVASLGVTDLRSADYEIATGLPTADVSLTSHLNNVLNFGGCTVEGTVDGIEFGYNVAAVAGTEYDAEIKATPADVNAVRAAYQALAANVVAGVEAADDSMAVIPAGTEVHIGADKLVFNSDCVINPSAATTPVVDVQMDRTEEIAGAVIYVPAGSKIQVGSSTAVLSNGMTVEVSAEDLSGESVAVIPATILSDLGAAIESGEATVFSLVLEAVTTVNEAAKNLNGNKLIVNVTFDEEEVVKDWKFYASIESAFEGNGTFADVRVFDDYSAVATVEGTIVNPALVEAYVAMKNVAGLGVTGERTAEFAFETGLPAAEVDLQNHLANIFAFRDATVNGKVNGAAFAYGVVADEEGGVMTAVATPDSTADVRAAWQIVAGEVTASTDAENSKIVVPAGATLQVGTEKLTFEGEATVDPNGNNLKGAVEAVQAAAVLETGLAESATEAYIPAGAKLQVGASVATLDRGATVKVTDGIVADGVLAALRTAANGDNKAYELVNTVVEAADAAVGALSAAGEMDVEILFDYYVTAGEETTAVVYGEEYTVPAGIWTVGSKIYYGGDKFVVTEDVELAEYSYSGGYVPTPTTPSTPEVDETEELKAAVDALELVARSEMSSAKGKKAVKIRWYCENGTDLDFIDGFEIFRSTKRFEGYGTKPFFTTTRNAYWNTDIEEGMKYYYKVRAYVLIDGEKYYTDWSLKAWRTVE